MNTEDLRKRFEAAMIARRPEYYLPGDFDLNLEGRYRLVGLQAAWEGFQMASKAALTEEQVEAIEVSLVYLNDKLAESDDAVEEGDEDRALWLANSAALRKHIAALRLLAPIAVERK